jgi:DNA-binding beta-propeller fold protein YncE
MNTPSGIGDGEGFISPTGVAIEEAAGTLVVADALLNAVVRVDPEGNRTIVSRGTSFGEGRILISPVPIAVEADGNLVVVDNHDVTVVRVNPDTGDRTVVSGCPSLGCARADRIGDSEPPFAIFFRDMAIGDASLVGVGNVTTSGSFDPVFPAVMRVNLQTGTREVFSGCPAEDSQCVDGFFGSGPPLIVPTAIAVAADHLVVAESGAGLQAVVRVEPSTGNRTVVSGCVDTDCTAIRGSGPSFANPNGIAVAADGYLVVDGGSTASNPVVARVDPTTGNRTIVSGIDPATGEIIGSGPRFNFPSAITVELDGSLVVVSGLVDFTALVRIDPDSGDRTIVSSNPLARNLPVQAIATLTFWETEGVFLLADRFNTLFRLTIDGEANLVGFMERPSKGLAFSADEEVLYSISPDDSELRTINPANALTVSVLPITLTGAVVSGGHGLARHPLTGELWALLALDDPTRLELAIIDPTTGVATRIGNTNDLFAGLAFDAGGTLYGVTDDAIAIPDKSLFILDTADATPTCVLALGRGDRGEAIAFNPVNALLYHAVGQFAPIFESIDPAQPPTCNTPATTMNIPLTFSGRGRGPSFVNPQRIAVEASGHLVVLDGMFGLQAVLRVDPATGNRTIVSR